MVPIKLAQYADERNLLYFVQYQDETHAYMHLDDLSQEAAQLRAWVAAGNTVAPYVPIISGGIVPAGAIMWFCSPRPPEGYLLCDGSAVYRAQYSRLFREIGTLYGSGDGATTFNLPNLVGRFCRGWGSVSPLDPSRTFGSYQEDDVGVHNHVIQAIPHTHTITDPGHIHGVTDPGHIHDIIDFGHNHTVSDPGHQHIYNQFSHVGYGGAYDIIFNGAIQFGSGGLFFGEYYYFVGQESANMVVATDPANLFLDTTQANVITDFAVTNVSINMAETNIPYTEEDGTSETRPDNVALLPVIRY